MDWINYGEFPSDINPFSSLFLDYINSYESVEKYYNGDFRDIKVWKARIQEHGQFYKDHSELVRVLTDQNKNFHCGVRTLANIDCLLNDNTSVIVTGQQVGIFTGPLYTIFKILTTLSLSSKLSEQFPDHNFVPIFWLEGEDHDFEEVSNLTFLDNKNDLINVSYQPKDQREDANYGSVGKIEFDSGIEDLIQQLQNQLLKTEFSQEVFKLLRIAYQPGMSFNRSFVHLINDLLLDSGLVFLDPNDPELKELLKPIFRRELENSPRTCTLIIDHTADLEKQYQAQIKPKPINLFFLHKNGRYLIEPHEEGYRLKGARQKFTKEELFDLLENSPHLFSPNVVLRPICQDAILPTLAYVAGPAEIAYFGQLKPAYEEYNLEMPIIYPRASATIIEDRVQRVFDRYSITLEDFFREVELVERKVLDQSTDIRIDELFGGTSIALDEVFTALENGLKQIDPTLAGSLSTSRNKIEYHLEGLKGKAIEAQKRNNEATIRQINKAHLHLFPSGKLQERNLNIIHFLNKYGLEFLQWLRSELIIDRFKHQLIKM